MDSKGNPRCAKTGSQMLVVAERLVLRFAAAAKGRAWQGLDGAVLTPDFDLAAHQQRPVANRRDRGRPWRWKTCRSPRRHSATWTQRSRSKLTSTSRPR